MSVSMCTKVLGRFIGDVILAASITKKKQNISLFGWMLPSLKWNRCECCWLNLLVQCNSWAFPNQASIQQVSCVTHSTHSRFRLPWTTVRCCQKWTNTLWWYLIFLPQLSPLGPTLGCICPQRGTSNGGILTYNWRESPSFQNSQKKLQDVHLKNPIFFGWMLEFCHHILFKPL